MKWNDLKSAWNHQDGPGLSDADLASLRQTFEAKHHQMARTLFWRDLRDAVVGLGVAALFGYAGWRQDRAFWPFALADVSILGVVGFLIAERIRCHRRRVGSQAPMLTKVEADIAELRHQRHLLLNVAKWGIAPIFVAWAIVLVTTIVNIPPYKKHHPAFLAVYVIIAVPVMTWGVWALNRRAVRRKIDPRIEDLESLYSELLRPE